MESKKTESRESLQLACWFVWGIVPRILDVDAGTGCNSRVQVMCRMKEAALRTKVN